MKINQTGLVITNRYLHWTFHHQISIVGSLHHNFAHHLYKLQGFLCALRARLPPKLYMCSTWSQTYQPITCKNVSRYLTNRFHVAVHLSSNRSQMTSKCGKNKKVAHEAIAECVTDVLTKF